MRKITLFTLFLTLTLGAVYGQQEKGITGYDNWLRNWTDFMPNKTDYAVPTQILSGNISKDTKLFKKDIYLLYGDVFVTDSTTLEIEPGTVIMGDFKTKGSLIVTKGSKIVAEGSVTDPIIFTSSQTVKKPGDWGGIFLLGDAPINSGNNVILNYGLDTSTAKNISYGGESTNSNSGILNYVRIEYAGKRTKNFGYFNALTLAGVGCDTALNNVMISYCDGNSVSVLGGDVLLNNFVSYRSSSDDYKVNHGATFKIINSLAIKSPYVSRAEGSRTLHVLNHDENTVPFTSKLKTKVEAENLTLLNQSNNLENDIKIGLVNEAIYVGEDVSFKLDKSVISGFNPAVIFDRKIKIDNESLDRIVFTRNYFNNCNGNIYIKYKPNNEDLENWYGNRVFNNVYSKGPDSETFINSKSTKNPDFRLRINRIIATNND